MRHIEEIFLYEQGDDMPWYECEVHIAGQGVYLKAIVGSTHKDAVRNYRSDIGRLIDYVQEYGEEIKRELEEE